MRIDVAPTCEALDPAVVGASTVLVVDVLRASTSIVLALANGCAAVVPVADPEEARRRATETCGALVAGKRRGEPLAGFDLGNSPIEFTADRVAGRTLVFTTSNGTRTLVAVRRAPAIGVAGFVNAGAAAVWAAGQGRHVLIACAGERGARSLEDLVCAGVLVDRLLATAPSGQPTAAAAEARRLAAPYAGDVGRLARDSSWARRLRSVGRGGDLEVCLALDTTPLVPVYRADVDKVVCPRG